MTTDNRNGANRFAAIRPTGPSPYGDNGGTQHEEAATHGGSAGEETARGAPSPSPSANGANGRDPGGRFAKGNAGGPGNPFARRTAQMRRVLCDAVSEEDLAAIARQMLEKAKGGDVAAAKLLLGYVVGQPVQAVDPDREETGM
jgi:hypothetical protein